MSRITQGTRPERFPFFPSGDVKVILTDTMQYQLHSSVLQSNSPIFASLLHPSNAAQLAPKAVKAGVTVRHKLVVVESASADGGTDYVFEPVKLDPSGRPVNGNPRGVRVGFDNGRGVPAALLAIGSVLGALYGEPIDLGDFHVDGLSYLLSNAVEITQVAEYLSCVHVVTKAIEASLLTTGQAVHRAIAEKPNLWLAFGHRIESKAIFREALIHGAGQYKQPFMQHAINNRELPPGAIAVLERKAEMIKSGVILAERHIASYYPSNLMREKTVGRIDRENLGRSNYGNQITGWIALSAFRHWCCDMMASDQTHNANDMGYAFIQATKNAGQAYLSTHVMQTQFHERFPMSTKLMACVEHRLDEIKANVRQWAEPLLRNSSHLDVKQYPVDHYTHIRVDNSDYPWLTQNAMDATGSGVDAADYDDNEGDNLMQGGSGSYGAGPSGNNNDDDGDEEMELDEGMGADDQVKDIEEGEDDYGNANDDAVATNKDTESIKKRSTKTGKKRVTFAEAASEATSTTKPRNRPFIEEDDDGSDTELDDPEEMKPVIAAVLKENAEAIKRREARAAREKKE